MTPTRGMLVLWLWRLPSQIVLSGEAGLAQLLHIALLKDLIRPRQQRRWDRQAERLGGLEVDDQLELRGLLDGEVAGLRTLEDAVDVGGRAAELVGKVRAIRHQAAGHRVLAEHVHGW